jgi:uncharacterized membrane protein
MSDDRSPRWSDTEIEQLVGRLLQIGVMLAAAVVLIGGILYLARHGGEHASYAVFRGEPESLSTVRGVVGGLASFAARNVIQFGLLLLIGTPIARVAFSIIGFAAERDRLYIGITALVLALLLYGLFGG